MLRSKKAPYVVMILIVILGIVGFSMNSQVMADVHTLSKSQLNKFFHVVQLVKMYYVEDVEWDKAIAGAISGMLSKLDPHSVYIEPKKVERNKESFSGHYEGIGIEFDVIDGYITVISPIAGSPSDRLGLLPGDKIIKINGKSAYGIKRSEVPKKLKGPKGTTVEVTILREGEEEPFDLTIERDVIPIFTVTTHFMADDSTGYIMVNRFASTTTEETEKAIKDLLKQGMKRLILDLRGNPGGYLHEAVKMAGKFIAGHKLIVETRGRDERVHEQFFSDQWRTGPVYSFPLVILIDRGSASASEIVSGAIQDYDRGLIVGYNSFGKGLVQKEFPLSDGSAVRVTTAKYYTPSGRLIQRPYKGKDVEEYYQELGDTTLTSEDSLANRPKYYTQAGRVVYGGGGIMPDIEVPFKSYSKSPKLRNKMMVKRVYFDFANHFAKEHPEYKTDVKTFYQKFKVSDELFEEFKRYCREKDVKFEDEEFDKDREYISVGLKAQLAEQYWGRDAYYYIVRHHDNQFITALNSFDEANRIAILGHGKNDQNGSNN